MDDSPLSVLDRCRYISVGINVVVRMGMCRRVEQRGGKVQG